MDQRESGPSHFRTLLRSPLQPASVPATPVCRLGLATRGDTRLRVEDVRHALKRGVNFLNWCGVPDPLSRVVAGLGPRRPDVVVCVQFEARTAAEAETELGQILRELNTDYVDVLTFYYVEEPGEWRQIIGPGGALEYCRRAQRDGRVRLLGLTSISGRWRRKRPGAGCSTC
jgi:predicted aldo/keto reductase-like oxidoreductase